MSALSQLLLAHLQPPLFFYNSSVIQEIIIRTTNRIKIEADSEADYYAVTLSKHVCYF